MQVRPCQQRVVVEHLLEVRDEPLRVDRVSREAPADLVVHASARHRPQGLRGHLALAAAEQELDHRGGRELRRAAESAVVAVEGPAQDLDRVVEPAGVDGIGRRLEQRTALEPLGDPVAASADLVAVLVPSLGHGFENPAPARHPAALLGREVRARVERDLVGRQEGVQGPAAVPVHRDAGLHVDRVDVGTLLAVELDWNEASVHQRGDLRVLERLALHHVAPVAR